MTPDTYSRFSSADWRERVRGHTPKSPRKRRSRGHMPGIASGVWLCSLPGGGREAHYIFSTLHYLICLLQGDIEDSKSFRSRLAGVTLKAP